MLLDARRLINSSFGVSLAFWLGRTTPNKVGLHLARVAADWIASHSNWDMVRAVRANRWVVSGEQLQADELDGAVRATFRHTAGSIFRLYHNCHSLEAMQALVDIDPVTQRILFRPNYDERGVVVVGLHLGNFDLVLQTVGLMGLNALILTLPELPGGYKLQYDIRRRTGMNLVPASIASLRQAIDHLRTGGMVITGIDRPEDVHSYRPMFFNHPSALPVHHVVLALKARVPVRVVCSRIGTDGRYHLSFTDPIEMIPHPDHKHEILSNAEAILKVSEGFISQTPEQWEMTFPVWPEALDKVPG